MNHPPEIESVLQEVLKNSKIDEVEASIIYSMLKSDGRTQQFLKKRLADLTEEDWAPSVPSTHKVAL
jgi:hypothetical protein